MNKQNASPKKTIEIDFVGFHRQPTKLITQLAKERWHLESQRFTRWSVLKPITQRAVFNDQ